MDVNTICDSIVAWLIGSVYSYASGFYENVLKIEIVQNIDDICRKEHSDHLNHWPFTLVYCVIHTCRCIMIFVETYFSHVSSSPQLPTSIKLVINSKYTFGEWRIRTLFCKKKFRCVVLFLRSRSSFRTVITSDIESRKRSSCSHFFWVV